MTFNNEGRVEPADLMIFAPPVTHRLSDFDAHVATSMQGVHLDPILSWLLRRPTGKQTRNHPSALRVSGLTMGRTVVRFSLIQGELGTYRVVSKVFVYDGSLQIRLQDLKTGLRSNFRLSNLGVLPSEPSYNFVVDHRKRHLVAKPPFIDSSISMPRGPVGFGKTSLPASFYLAQLEELSE